MSDFPVDEGNLSFSGDECENLFITQSVFRNVNTQEVSKAVDYFNDFSDMSFGEVVGEEKKDLQILSQNSEEMCAKVFDFSEDQDNGWSVSTQDANFIVTRNSDGKEFAVPRNDESCSKVDCKNNNVSSVVMKDLDIDLKHFSSIATEAQLEELKRKRYEKSTQIKIKWAMKAYVRWMNCCNYQVEHGLISSDRKVPDPDKLVTLSKEEIVKVISMFILEVKNGNGEDYNRDTLYDLIVMVQSFFKQNGKPYRFFDDNEFFGLRNTLDNRMKDLSKQGKIAPRIKAEPISLEEKNKLWETGVLGEDTPTKLVDTLLYLLGIHFALRAADDHKSLKVNAQFSVHNDDKVGLKYLYYEEQTSKCNQGDITTCCVDAKKGRAYQNIVNSDRCVVRLFEKYMSKHPDHLPKCSKDFYLRPLSVPNGDVWYSCQPRGRHAIEKVIKEICKEGEFTGKRTNHSCRASSATCMYEQGADEQLICEKTGHRSVAVRSYKRTLNRQLKQVSDMLYGNDTECNEKPLKFPKKEATSTVSAPPQLESNLEHDQGKTQCIDPKVESNVQQVARDIQIAKGITLNININVNK